jgi:hypothetical protein
MQRLAVKFSRGADFPVAAPLWHGRSSVSPEFNFLRVAFPDTSVSEPFDGADPSNGGLADAANSVNATI